MSIPFLKKFWRGDTRRRNGYHINMINWDKMETEYVTGDLSYKQLADKYGVSKTSIGRRAIKHDWTAKRRRHRDETYTEVARQSKADAVDANTKIANEVMEAKLKLAEHLNRVCDRLDWYKAADLKRLAEMAVILTPEIATQVDVSIEWGEDMNQYAD